MPNLHLLRPWFLLAFIPALIWLWLARRTSSELVAWQRICDPQLLRYLLKEFTDKSRQWRLYLLFFIISNLIIALSGPSWVRLPQPNFKNLQARILLLDLSESMLANDLSPDRLSRARFALHEVLAAIGPGPVGLIAYTSQPFVISPMTEDPKTIDALLDVLHPNIMPVQGQDLVTALTEARAMLRASGLRKADLLILTAEPPSEQAIQYAARLAQEGLRSSILAIAPGQIKSKSFRQFAREGRGNLLALQNFDSDLDAWLRLQKQSEIFEKSQLTEVPLWQDNGRWFLLPALLAMLFFCRPSALRGLLS